MPVKYKALKLIESISTAIPYSIKNKLWGNISTHETLEIKDYVNNLPTDFEVMRNKTLTDFSELCNYLYEASLYDLLSPDNSFHVIAEDSSRSIYTVHFSKFNQIDKNEGFKISLKYFAQKDSSQEKNSIAYNQLDKLLFGTYDEQIEAENFLIPSNERKDNFFNTYFSIELVLKNNKFHFKQCGIGNPEDLNSEILEITKDIVKGHVNPKHALFEYVVPLSGDISYVSRYYTKAVFPKIQDAIKIVKFLTGKIIDPSTNVITPLSSDEVVKLVEDWSKPENIVKRIKIEERLHNLLTEKSESEQKMKDEFERNSKRFSELTGYHFLKVLNNKNTIINKWFKSPALYIETFKKQLDEANSTKSLMTQSQLSTFEIEALIYKIKKNIHAIEDGIPLYEVCKKQYRKIQSFSKDKRIEKLQEEYGKNLRLGQRIVIAKKNLGK